MSKTGQARMLTPEQFAYLLSVIQASLSGIIEPLQISFKLGLRVQEIALLQIKDVAELGPETAGERSFKLKEILALPAAYTKGADALKRENRKKRGPIDELMTTVWK